MKAALVQRTRLELLQQRPHFVAGDISGHRLLAAGTERPTLGENCRRERGARMPVHAHIVVIEHMRRDAVDQRGIGRRQIAADRDFRCAVIRRRRRNHSGDDLHGLFVRPGDHGADTVEHSDARTETAAFRHGARVVDRDDVRMLQRSGKLRFGQEPLAESLILR